MPVLNLSGEELLGLFLRLLPRGRVWSRDPSSVLARSLSTLMPSWERLLARDNALLSDAFPSMAYELLPEWESSLGLPDPCAGDSPTLQARRMQVVARLTNSGGQSRAYMVAVAASLGVTTTITEFAPARLGRMRLGDRMRNAAWGSAWQVNLPSVTPVPFRLGESGLGERFRTWGSSVVECELSAAAPAHTILRFAYPDGSGIAEPLGTFVLGRDLLA